MARATVRIEGAEDLKAQLRRLGSAVEAVMTVAATEGAIVIRDEARSRAPGPHVEVEQGKTSAKTAEVNIGPDAAHWYYGFFETGTSRHPITPTKKKGLAFAGREGDVVRKSVEHQGMKARPFLRPALEAAKEAATKKVGDVLRRAIEAVAKG